MAIAVALQGVAYLAYCAGAIRGLHASSSNKAETISTSTSEIFIVGSIGAIALLLKFGSVQRLLAYFTGNVNAAEGAGLIGAILTPLLAVSGVLALRHALRPSASGAWWTVVILGLVLGLGTSGYSRGMLAVALLASLAAISRTQRRVSLPLLVVLAIAGGALALVLGRYRRYFLRTDAGRLSPDQVGLGDDGGTSVRAILEVYMRAPQYLGVIPEAMSRGDVLRPTSIGSNVLAPIPIFGEPYREGTSRIRFSEAVRGTVGTADLSPPLVGELYWAFGIWAVLVAFPLLGWAVRRIDRAYWNLADPGLMFLATFSGIWLGYLLVGSGQVIVQTIIYYGPSLALLYLLVRRHSRRTT